MELRNIIELAKGNSLAYALGAMQSYVTQIREYSFLSIGLMEKVVAAILDTNVNVSKMALKIVNVFTHEGSPSQGAISYIVSKKEDIPFADLLKMVPSIDVEGQIELLCFINNLMKLFANSKEDEKLFKKLQDLGINELLMVKNFFLFF